MELVKFLEKKRKKFTFISWGSHIDGHEKKTKLKESKNPRFYGLNKLCVLAPCPSAFGKF
jgi:hypothetical protein